MSGTTGITGRQVKDESLTGDDIQDGSVGRPDLNASTPGQAVVRKLLAGAGITLNFSGADPGTGDVEIVNQLAQDTGLLLETIWAEENAALGNNQREWSFGNGSTGAVNVIAMYDCEITKMFIHAESPGATASINVMINNVSAGTGTFNANGVFTFPTAISVSEGDAIGFQTNTVTGGWTDVRVGVLLSREILGLEGPQGPQGDPGPPGATNHSGLVLDDGTNPHGTTQADVGLGNVDNTSDLNKPISTATQAALDLKYDASNPNSYETPAQLNARDTANRDRANHTGTQPASTITGLATVSTTGNHSDLNLDDGTNPHGTTAADVGLGNVDNTSDLNKPVSTAQQAALDLKYDASNPAGYETPAQLDVRDTANRDRANHTGTQPATTITGLAPVATGGNHSDLNLDDGTNPHGTTKADVGLGNADNTSDLDKPISTATQAALDLKADESIQINSVAGETTGGGDLTANRTIGLADVITAGSSSAADSTLDITVDAKGRITAFTRTAIAIVASQVTDFANAVRSTVLTGISFATYAAITATDTVLEAFGKLQRQITVNGYGETALNAAGLVKNTQVFEVFLTLNATVPVAGLYKITWTYVWSLNDAANDFVGQCRVNGGVIYDHIQEPKDSGGGGVTLPNTDGGNADTGTNQRHAYTVHEVVNLSAGANTADIQFRCSTNNDRAAIYRGRISIEKFGVS